MVPCIRPAPRIDLRFCLGSCRQRLRIRSPPRVSLCCILGSLWLQVLPDAVHRGGRGFQDNWRAGEIQPLRTPMSTLFDVEHLTAWAKQRQTVLHKVMPLLLKNADLMLSSPTSMPLSHPRLMLMDKEATSTLLCTWLHSSLAPGRSGRNGLR